MYWIVYIFISLVEGNFLEGYVLDFILFFFSIRVVYIFIPLVQGNFLEG